jgi:hypothetical protein
MACETAAEQFQIELARRVTGCSVADDAGFAVRRSPHPDAVGVGLRIGGDQSLGLPDSRRLGDRTRVVPRATCGEKPEYRDGGECDQASIRSDHPTSLYPARCHTVTLARQGVAKSRRLMIRSPFCSSSIPARYRRHRAEDSIRVFAVV